MPGRRLPDTADGTKAPWLLQVPFALCPQAGKPAATTGDDCVSDSRSLLTPTECRPLAFFGIDIHSSAASIRGWVRWCHDQGLGGFNLIVQTGCKGRANPEWMEELLSAYETAIAEAQRLGLEVWIFDDWGYPSGTAGGLVCDNDQYRARQLVLAADVTISPHTEIDLGVIDHFLSAGIYDSRGAYTPLACRPGERITCSAEDEPKRLVAVGWQYFGMKAKSVCVSEDDPAMSLIDMLNPRAAERFTQVMHELYKSRLGKYFGKTIKGFFYDEPYTPFPYPWTEDLPAEFQRRAGYDLLPVLPRILAEPAVNKAEARNCHLDYWNVWTDMAAEYFYGVLAEWCHKNGLELSGHADLDHRIQSLNSVSGHFFKDMAVNDRPAHDVIWAQIEPGRFTDFPRYGASVKRVLGKKSTISETFAAMGYALHTDLMRYIVDHQVVRGIDAFHLMYSTNNPPDFGTNPLCPNHILSEPFGKELYHRIAMSISVARYGKSCGGTALYFPCLDIYRWQSLAGVIGSDNYELPIWSAVGQISEALCYLPCCFDYIWDEAILSLRLGSHGFVTGEGYEIDTVVLPPDCLIPTAVSERLNEFVASGGRILSLLHPSRGIQKFTTFFEIDELKNYIAPLVNISPRARISAMLREKGGTKLFLLLNESREPFRGKLSFPAKHLYRVDMRDGVPIELPGPTVDAVMEGDEMQVYITSSEPLDAKAPEAAAGEPILPYDWSVEAPDGKRVGLPDGGAWPDWSQLGFPGYSGSISYRSRFRWAGEGPARLSVPGLRYQAEIHIDGRLAGKLLFKPYAVNVGTLSEGEHQLELKVFNTYANKVYSTPYPPVENMDRFLKLADYDRKRLKSGIGRAPTLTRLTNGADV